MNANHIRAIALKDLREVAQNRSAWLPMIIVPLIFILFIPLGFILIPPAAGVQATTLTSDADVQMFMQHMPPTLMVYLQGLDDFQKILMLFLGFFFAPFFLIFPLMFSTIIGSESFAGEKERKTLEALLYTPASDAELFLGKALAALVPAVALTWGSFFLYSLVLNVAGYPLFGRIWFPLPTWWPLIFWITPALALLGVSATVLISARTHTFMGAYQSSASLVLLVLFLLVGQATGVLYLTVGVGLLIGLAFWLIAAVTTVLAIRGFNRTSLLIQNK